ncbi:hypothetical protein MAP00_002960 [Monascus purpureus]|nr:hypothetical protein MAP00_002960 [Monascus purpureus]
MFRGQVIVSVQDPLVLATAPTREYHHSQVPGLDATHLPRLSSGDGEAVSFEEMGKFSYVVDDVDVAASRTSAAALGR